MSRLVASALALLSSADALAISSSSHAPARPAMADSYAYASAAVNRDLSADPDPRELPPLPRMELVDMQSLDLELYDLETRHAEEWHVRLLGSDVVGADDDEYFYSAYDASDAEACYDGSDLSAGTFIRN